MSDKRYKLTEEVQFSIDIDSTLHYTTFLEGRGYDVNSIFFHVAIVLYHKEYTRKMSIYMTFTEMMKEEYKSMKRSRLGFYTLYKPSEEFIQILRGAAIIVAEKWRLRKEPNPNREILDIIHRNASGQKARNDKRT